jgi:type IV pilus assembly protein PilM
MGVDVSSTAVKILELSGGGGKFRIEAYAVEPLPANAVVEKNITDVEVVGEAIGRAMKRAQTKNKLSALAVPGSAVITKVITMPGNLSDDEMASQIELEADQYIPYSLDEVNLDFEVIGPSESDPDRVEVLLAASRNENVDVRVAAAEIGGLTCKIVDVEAFALENAFSLIAKDLPTGGIGETIALVDIGATMTTLSVLSDLKIIYAREQVFGGKQLTEEIGNSATLWFELRRSRTRQASGWTPRQLRTRGPRTLQGVDGPAGEPGTAILLLVESDRSGRSHRHGRRLRIDRGRRGCHRREDGMRSEHRQSIRQHEPRLEGQGERDRQ